MISLIESLLARFVKPLPDLTIAGLTAIREADRMWRRDIIDPPVGDRTHDDSRKAIDAMIRSADGLGWDWELPYAGDSAFEWCGGFAAWCWAKAGLSLHARKHFWSSTYRLDRWTRYQQANDRVKNPKPSAGPYRMIIDLDERSSFNVRFPDGTTPRAGDVLMIGPVASGYGKHVTLVESFNTNNGTFGTLEGNGFGLGPKGDRRQGVVRSFRPVGLNIGQKPTQYHARRLIRPAPSDLA